ncbi:MAG: MBL fold metallo-hydrolase [Verrucomicrobiota bacterium]|nr:MBL fold metallo-hydrolase [Verrucomicrobiota bacterium]
MGVIRRIATDVGWLPISFVNAYFLGQPGGPWVLIDTGVPGRASQIMAAAAARFGAGKKPEAIVLTHGHFDHAGSAHVLADEWDVPVYAHRLEFPYVSGRTKYPPKDPTVGGAIAFLSRFMPARAHPVGDRLRELPPNETLPGMPDWKWLHTPGHSPGHISLFRASDGVLIAGDAFATMDMDSWSGLLSGKQTLARAGSPFNCDWEATKNSVQTLAKLRPNVIGAGHGIPLTDENVAQRLENFATRFRPPRHGRYVHESATTNENGVVSLPPAPFDPVPFATAASLLLAGIALGAGAFDDKNR